MESKEKLSLSPPALSSSTDLTGLPQKEQVEKLHVIYHEQEEVLSDIRDELRKCVPVSECKHIEMCISDVEVVNLLFFSFQVDNRNVNQTNCRLLFKRRIALEQH